MQAACEKIRAELSLLLFLKYKTIFFSQVMNGVEEVARQKGYHVLIYLTHEDQQRETDILHMLRSGRVEGVMISVSNTTKSFEHLEAYRKEDIPLIFFDRVCESTVSYTHLRAHETPEHLVCRL